MASVADICNLGLGRAENKAQVKTITPPENTTESKLCAKYYPIARDVTLAWSAWGFAKRFDTLTPLSNPIKGWSFRYKAPSLMLQPLGVYISESDIPQPFDYGSHDTDGIVIHTNADLADIEFIKLITDTTKFSPLCVDAMGWLLGSYLAGPLTEGLKLGAALRQKFEELVGPPVTAALLDANASQRRTVESSPGTYVPSSIRARQG